MSRRPVTPAATPRHAPWVSRAFPLYAPRPVLALLTVWVMALGAFVLSMAYRGLYGTWPAW